MSMRIMVRASDLGSWENSFFKKKKYDRTIPEWKRKNSMRKKKCKRKTLDKMIENRVRDKKMLGRHGVQR